MTVTAHQEKHLLQWKYQLKGKKHIIVNQTVVISCVSICGDPGIDGFFLLKIIFLERKRLTREGIWEHFSRVRRNQEHKYVTPSLKIPHRFPFCAQLLMSSQQGCCHLGQCKEIWGCFSRGPLNLLVSIWKVFL